MIEKFGTRVVLSMRRIQIVQNDVYRTFDLYLDNDGKVTRVYSALDTSEVIRCDMDTLKALFSYLEEEGET